MQTFDSSHRYQSNKRVEMSDTTHCCAVSPVHSSETKAAASTQLPAVAVELRGAFCHHCWVSSYYLTFLVPNRAPTQADPFV